MSSTTPSTVPASALPRYIDPRKFAQQRVDISGEVDVDKLNRLQPLLACNDKSKISGSLKFGIDEQGIRHVTGTIYAELEMVCQRCLEGAPQILDVSVNLGIVWSDEQAANLSKTWDPWILEEGQTDIYQMIEDELILGLPIVAYHGTACIAHSLYSTDDSITGDDSIDDAADLGKRRHPENTGGAHNETPNPFQVLEELKGSLKTAPDMKNTDVTKR